MTAQTFDARLLAVGRLSVAVASATDDDKRSALYRTVYVERFDRGVRLVASDSYVLLHAWVPELDEGLSAKPDLDESPIATAVVMDPNGRGRGLLKHLLKLANAEGAPLIEATLELGVLEAESETARPTFDGLEAVCAVLEHPDNERLRLPTFEGDFPPWRNLFVHHKPKSTRAVALNPDIVGRLSVLGGLHPFAPLEWYFGGEHGAARLAIGVPGGEVRVDGLVMPERWNLVENRPHDEVKADEDEA